MTTRIPVQPALMHWAVERAGKHPADFDTQIQEWIAGTKHPTLKQLQDFAKKVHVPFGYLLLQEPPEETLPLPDFRTRKNKAVGRISPDLRDVIYQYQRQQDWFREYMLRNDMDEVSLVGQIDYSTSVGEAAAFASVALELNQHTRKTFNSWSSARRFLIDQLEERGILVAVSGIVGSNTKRTLDPTEFGGFALVDEYAPLIFVNGVDSTAAQIFTLVHEFIHILVGEAALTDDASSFDSDEQHEQWCNRVAAEVLVPLTELNQLSLPRDPREAAQFVASHFRVSTLVSLKRLHEAGIINWETYVAAYEDELAALPPKTKTSSGGEYYNTQLLRLGRRFASALISDTLEGRTSYGDAFRLLRSSKRSVFDQMSRKLGIQ